MSENNYVSIAVQPELYLEWADGAQLLKFTGFARWEQHDIRRTHADIRELYWQLVKKDREFSVGLKKISWGVTESVHLVDVINQTDAVESYDGEEGRFRFPVLFEKADVGFENEEWEEYYPSFAKASLSKFF